MEKEDLSGNINRQLKGLGFTRLLVGLSGGADSTALLRLLIGTESYRQGLLRLKCVHCNFHLRGEESMRDQAFCEDLCNKLGISLIVVDFDALSTSRDKKVSIEVACRQLRYDFFSELIKKENWDMVAVAHHLEDNAETLLLNLMRGSGINGLKGMRPINGNIYRPLLGYSRKILLEYLSDIGQNYIVDSTNLQTDYRRNFLRLEVIPLLESRWPEAARAIAKSAELLQHEADILNEYIRGKRSDNNLGLDLIRKSSEPVTEIFYFIKEAGGSPSIAREVWNSLCSPDSPTVSGKWWKLGNEHRLSLERGFLEILKSPTEPLKEISISKVSLTHEILEEIIHNQDQRIAWIPCKENEIIIRGYRPGDRIRKSQKSSALVSKLMKDAKFTRRQKESTPIVTDLDGNILWVAGLRRSCTSLVSPSHSTVIRLELKET